MKIIYAGSPEAACETLKILYENQQECGFEIAGVLSNPPSAKGRHKELTPTPVAAFALEKNIPVFTPEHLNGEAREQIEPLKADLLVCFAYGHIFGPKFLAMFPMGGMNLHPSLLPKYRGCTPVNAALINNDEQTAVTIQTLSLKMDEGDILAQKLVDLTGNDKELAEFGELNAENLLNYSAKAGAELICSILKQTATEGKIPEGKKQEGEPSYTGTISKEDAKINWQETSAVIAAKVRGYYGNPGAWTLEKGLPLKIMSVCAYEPGNEAVKAFETEEYKQMAAGTVVAYNKGLGILVKTGAGLLSLKLLQRQGKNPMNYKDFMNGARDFVGTVLE